MLRSSAGSRRKCDCAVELVSVVGGVADIVVKFCIAVEWEDVGGTDAGRSPEFITSSAWWAPSTSVGVIHLCEACPGAKPVRADTPRFEFLDSGYSTDTASKFITNPRL